MTVLNVHAQWYPMNGEVLVSKHHDGRFMAAYLPKSSTENERSTVVIRNEKGITILMRQIAGAMARRIVTYAKPGSIARVNEQMGFIKFGSRVDLFLPLGSEVLVKMHEKVTGDITTIARLK
jgi:phosphatidylserine decarboxylase